MASRSLSVLGLLLLSLAVALAQRPGQWIRARSTFYGGPRSFTDSFDVKRGIGSFGVLEYGSCGFTNTIPGQKGANVGNVPFPKGAVAAAADTNPDYPGSCGRCYEVKCKQGTVVGKGDKPVPLSSFTVLEDINSKAKDTLGRSYPGNPGKPKGQQYVKCWPKQKSVIVNVIDSCPCQYRVKLPDGKFKIVTQQWCCGDQKHFDLSYWAFEQLAHPVYGVMMVDFRPVDCITKKPLQYLPGFVSSIIYRNKVGSGWNWFAYGQQSAYYAVKGAGVTQTPTDAATCISVAKGGAISFQCRQCFKAGYQPFGNKKKGLVFWIRSNTKSSVSWASSTPKGKIPPLKLFLMRDPADSDSNLKGPDHITAYCNQSPILGKDVQPVATRKGGWYRFDIPLSKFECQGDASIQYINRFDFQNVQVRNAEFCLDEIKLHA